MRMLIGLFALLLVFGCIGNGEEKPPEPVVNETNVTEKPPPVTIIIEEQKNQTREEQVPEKPPEQNVTVEETTEIQYTYDPNQTMGIYFIDVAGPKIHGNSVLIKRGDLDILIDAGSEEYGGEVVDFLKSREVDDIDLLISSNADPRHYGGIQEVFDNFEIEHFWWTGSTFADTEYIELTDDIKESVKEHRIVEKGYSTELNDIEIKILNPPAQRFDDINNDAIVTKVTDGNFTVLITSGIQKGAVQKLANEQAKEIKCMVIQAPYFGTGEGTRDIGLFLLTADPETMIITGSADDSPENGGSREPFERLLAQYGIDSYKTYELGSLRITTDGNEYVIQAVSTD